MVKCKICYCEYLETENEDSSKEYRPLCSCHKQLQVSAKVLAFHEEEEKN